MGSFEVRVSILRPLATVFAVYTDPDTFHWCSYLRSVRWVRGKPWEEESRLEIETDDAIRVVVDQVLTGFEARSRVDFISHFSGITLITRMTFRAVSDQETEINGKMEFVGTFSRIAGFAVESTIERRTRQCFDDLKRECEKSIPQAVSQAANPSPTA
jgi:hypothetical protein